MPDHPPRQTGHAIDRKEIWRDTTLWRMVKEALKKLPEQHQGQKEAQSQVTAGKAMQEMLNNLEKKVVKQLSK